MVKKVALISMGCVQLCSRARAIRILMGAEEFSSDTFYSYNITDMNSEEKQDVILRIRGI